MNQTPNTVSARLAPNCTVVDGERVIHNPEHAVSHIFDTQAGQDHWYNQHECNYLLH